MLPFPIKIGQVEIFTRATPGNFLDEDIYFKARIFITCNKKIEVLSYFQTNDIVSKDNFARLPQVVQVAPFLLFVDLKPVVSSFDVASLSLSKENVFKCAVELFSKLNMMS